MEGPGRGRAATESDGMGGRCLVYGSLWSWQCSDPCGASSRSLHRGTLKRWPTMRNNGGCARPGLLLRAGVLDVDNSFMRAAVTTCVAISCAARWCSRGFGSLLPRSAPEEATPCKKLLRGREPNQQGTVAANTPVETKHPSSLLEWTAGAHRKTCST
jgi:hypothetical protein